ncbi:MAG: ABC transporter substrate-binding protein [Oscillospiraceae bacterium]|nr:ABC transporter substrate-binding protein [Oscillospiraceae bacterium]
MMKRKILALALAAAMLAALLAGCAGGTAVNTREEVTIGILAPKTGDASQFGVAVYQGLTLYIEQFNAQDNGLQIHTRLFDEEGLPERAVIGYNSLVDFGVTAIIGSVTSGPTMAVVPRAFEDGMPMITATATHANVTVNAEDGSVFTNMFRACFIDPYQGEKMALFAVEELGATTAAILYSHEIDYSVGLKNAFVQKAGELGLEIVAEERFADQAVDFRAQLTNIAQASPDVLFVPAYYRHVGLIGPQSAEVGLDDTTFLGADGWATIGDFMGDTSSIEGAYFLTGFSPDAEDAMVQQFIADYTQRWGEAPNMFAAQAFDAAMILIAAIQRTLAADTDIVPGSDEFKAALIAQMAVTDLTGVTGHVTFDAYNNPQKTAVILNMVDGKETFWGYF